MRSTDVTRDREKSLRMALPSKWGPGEDLPKSCTEWGSPARPVCVDSSQPL